MADEYQGPLPGMYWVLPGRLLAGPYPGRANNMLMPEWVEQLLSAGITSFINLTEEGELTPYLSLLPPHVRHYRLPIPDYQTPVPTYLKTILDTIDGLLVEGQLVYLHCWGGTGRTGTVAGCYLVRQGMTGIDAVAEITRRRGRYSPETEAQRQRVIIWNE
jgi:protein-tyrosine phosphatase